MKKTVILLLIVLTIFAGCKKDKSIIFCEGISIDGDGVKCGTKFEYGDMLAIIKSKEPFGVKKIKLHIFIDDKMKSTVEIIDVDVDPDKKEASANITLIKGGKYLLTAKSGQKKIAEGNIEIVD